MKRIKECHYSENNIIQISYRPFHNLYIYYDKDLLGRSFYNVMQHLLKGDNFSLLTCRQQSTFDFQHIFISKLIADMCSVSLQTKETSYIFPLYTYPEAPQIKKFSAEKKADLEKNYQIEFRVLNQLEKCFKNFEKLYETIESNPEQQKIYQTQQKDYLKQKSVVDKLKTLLDADNVPLENLEIFDKQQQRQPNFNTAIIQKIADGLGLKFIDEKEDNSNTFAPIDVLDYIYAVLHSSNYRKTYKEFLKVDFPRIPYPEKNTFWQFVKLGSELRGLHLLESETLLQSRIEFKGQGDNKVERKISKGDFQITDSVKNTGQVWINNSQYFDAVPVIAWEFYIGGYQPAQKWLKDRQGRVLNFEDILHYQKVIKALAETARMMQEVDLICEW